jgi:hypothetical protein
MTLARSSDEENRKAFEARKTLEIMTPFVDFSIRVPAGAGVASASLTPVGSGGSRP